MGKISLGHLVMKIEIQSACLVGWLVSKRPRKQLGYISRTDPKTERLAILRAATHETEWEDHDFCLSQSHEIRAAEER